MTTTHTLELPDVDLVYDVHGPIPTTDGQPLLFMIGQPMTADGFTNVRQAYQDRGFGHGMAQFIALTMWEGEFTDEYFSQPPADPAMFGMPADDDGTRDDPLLSERSLTVTRHRYDLDAIAAAPTRVLLGFGEETGNAMTVRSTNALASLLGSPAVIFPSHHGGFVGGGPDNPYGGKPVEFGETLRDVLNSTTTQH